MKKVIAAIAAICMTLSLAACGGGGTTEATLDKTITMPDGTTFQVSSSWEEMEPTIKSFESDRFQVGEGDIEITYFQDDYLEPYESHENVVNSAAESNSITNFKDISQEDIIIDEATCVIFEYSATYSDTGDMTTKTAYLSCDGNSTINIFYRAPSSNYDPSSFDAVLQSFKFG